MSANSYLTGLASELVLNGTEKDHVSKSVDTIKARLSAYFGSDVTEKKGNTAQKKDMPNGSNGDIIET